MCHRVPYGPQLIFRLMLLLRRVLWTLTYVLSDHRNRILLLVTRVNFRPLLQLISALRRRLCRVLSIVMLTVSGYTQPHTRHWPRLRRRWPIYCVMSIIRCRRLVPIATTRLLVSVKIVHLGWVLNHAHRPLCQLLVQSAVGLLVRYTSLHG